MIKRKNDDKYPAKIAPLWDNKFGGYNGMVMDEELLSNLQEIVSHMEVGGRLSVFRFAERPEGDNGRTPHACIRYETPAQVNEQKLAYEGFKKKGNKQAIEVTSEDTI